MASDGSQVKPAGPELSHEPEPTSYPLRGNDPGYWGHSLANLLEILVPLLGAIEATSVLEIGAYAGDLTRDLAAWADRRGASVVAIDPTPQPELAELAKVSSVELVREPSLEALRRIPLGDAVIIDGDHNYYTVSEELGLIGERSAGVDIPLLLLHDVGWPHGRRDVYYAPERIPEGERQPMAEGGGLVPGEPGLVDAGLPYQSVANSEGGPRNGVLTATEDFVTARSDLNLAILSPFFGLGVIWHRDALWADAVEAIVAPWDRNPLVARLEANRVHHLSSKYAEVTRLQREIEALRRRSETQAGVLRELLSSRALALADRISRLRHPGKPSTRDGIEQFLRDSDSG